MPIVRAVAGAILFSTVVAEGGSRTRLPPSFGTDGDGTEIGYREDQPLVRRFGLGVFAGVPELGGVEGLYELNRYVGFRVFLSPPFPFNIRVEMPRDQVSKADKGFKIEHPDAVIKLKALYGPQYGVESLVRPFGGAYFLSLGASARTFSVGGQAQTPLIISPVGSSESFTTRTEIGLKAKAVTSAYLLRVATGWVWHVFSRSYVNLTLAGVARPKQIRNDVAIEAFLDSPSGSSSDVQEALAELKEEKEAELREKTLAAIDPVAERVLPIISIGFGLFF